MWPRGGQSGYYFDPETNLYLLGGGGRGRYYDPQLARFQNADPTGIASGDPNLYRYVANDPVNRRDPSGNQDEENSSAVAAQLIDKAKQGLKRIGDQEFREFLKEIPQSRVANFEREHNVIAVHGDEKWHFFRRKEGVDFIPPEQWNYTEDIQGSFNTYSLWSYEGTEPGNFSREAIKNGLDITSDQRSYNTRASATEFALHLVPLGTLADRIAGGTDDSVAYTALITLGDLTFVGGYLVKSAKGIKLVAATDIAVNSAGAAASAYQLANDSNNKSAHASEFALRLWALGLGIKHITKAHADELVPRTPKSAKYSTAKSSNVDKPSGASNNASGVDAPSSEAAGEIVGQINRPGQDLAGQIRLRVRQLELGWNHEQKRFDYQEGLGGARYEQASGNKLSKPAIDGVDFVDPKVGPISMKGPLGIDSRTGKTFQIDQGMVDGLESAVIKDIQRNTATKRVVVDMRGLSEAQRSSLIENIKNAAGNLPKKEIFFLN